MEDHVSWKKKTEKHAHIIFPGLFCYFDSICMFELEKQYIYIKKKKKLYNAWAL